MTKPTTGKDISIKYACPVIDKFEIIYLTKLLAEFGL